MAVTEAGQPAECRLTRLRLACNHFLATVAGADCTHVVPPSSLTRSVTVFAEDFTADETGQT
jgi:hypothetical protein